MRRAGLLAFREDLHAERIPMRFFNQTRKETRASVTPEVQREYEQLLDQLKQESPRSRRIGFAITPQNGSDGAA